MNSAAEKLSSHQAKDLLNTVVEDVGNIILGKEQQIRLALCCLLARGHLLIEDLPGVGKTVLSHVLAQALGLSYQRIQFTSDLLPADIIGVSIFDRESSSFQFHPGPVFSQLILADEINRATPKAQSALLEAMEEHQVSVEGETRKLPQPFFVIATQNPTYQIGTFPLPESQLDRFLMRLQVGYPDREAERTLLKGRDRRDLLTEMPPSITPEQLLLLQNLVPGVHASDALLDYVQALLEFSRNHKEFHTGLSPRAGLALLHCAQAWALMHGRDYVMPEDVQQVLPNVATHRLQSSGEYSNSSTQSLLAELLSVPIP
jgi:MoxR-like ATPase